MPATATTDQPQLPRLREWRVVFPDGTTAGMLSTSRANAWLTAAELMPGFVRIEQASDW